jgi:hypothetical protein
LGVASTLAASLRSAGRDGGGGADVVVGAVVVVDDDVVVVVVVVGCAAEDVVVDAASSPLELQAATTSRSATAVARTRTIRVP